jgi:hypothetical protein
MRENSPNMKLDFLNTKPKLIPLNKRTKDLKRNQNNKKDLKMKKTKNGLQKKED